MSNWTTQGEDELTACSSAMRAGVDTVSSTAASTATAMPLPQLPVAYTPIHRRPPKAKRNRKGWGRFKSVLKERSVDFNLSLDVQNLQQEIRQLTTARDLLYSRRRLQLQHSPTGSLHQVVREYFRLFREGFRVDERVQRRHVVTAGLQSDFLRSITDEEISFGHNMQGVDFMIEMIRRYSLLLRFIHMIADRFEIVYTDDDNVLIKTWGRLRFQILRETVVGMFPHVIGNVELLAKLIGADVESPIAVDFYFNGRGLLCRYETHADFAVSFATVLQDPADVMEVLGQARLNDNNMIGVTDDGQIEDVDVYVEPPSPPAHETPPTQSQDPRIVGAVVNQTKSPSFQQQVMLRYINMFSRGLTVDYQLVQSFLNTFMSPSLVCGQYGGHDAVLHHWQTLSDAFTVLGFRSQSYPQHTGGERMIAVEGTVIYQLRITDRTFERLFSRVQDPLLQNLVGLNIDCPSQLQFHWEHQLDPFERVTRIVEQLDWNAAFAPVLPDPQRRADLLQTARLSPEGYLLGPLNASASAKHPSVHRDEGKLVML